MLFAFVAAMFLQTTPAVWLAYVRPDYYAGYTPLQEGVFYFTFVCKVVSWVLVFCIVHEVLNSFLDDYDGLRLVGERLLRWGMGLAGVLVVSSALVAPHDLFGALSFLWRTEALWIYGTGTTLCAGTALFVWHFRLAGSPNDETELLVAFFFFSHIAALAALETLVPNSVIRPRTWAFTQLALETPILVLAALRFTADGATRPAASPTASEGHVRGALEDLNNALGRMVRS